MSGCSWWRRRHTPKPTKPAPLTEAEKVHRSRRWHVDGCITCGKELQPGDEVLVCGQRFDRWTLCEACYTAGPRGVSYRAHGDRWPRMYKEVVALEVDPSSALEGCTTVATALAATLQCYSERPCIGYPVPCVTQIKPKVPRAAISVGEPVLPAVGSGGMGCDCQHVDITWTCSECAAREDAGDIGAYRLSATNSLRVAAKASRTSQTLTMPIEETLSTATDTTATAHTGDANIDYNWISYAQVFEASRDFGVGLRELLKSKILSRTAAENASAEVVNDDNGAGPAYEANSAAPCLTRRHEHGFGEINVSISLKADNIFGDSYTLKVKINEGRGLRGMDTNGVSDPYVKIYVGKDKKEKTVVIKKTLAPKWDQEFVFHGITDMEARETQLQLSVWDWDRISANDFMGGHTVYLEDLVHNDIEDQWVLLGGEKLKQNSEPDSDSSNSNGGVGENAHELRDARMSRRSGKLGFDRNIDDAHSSEADTGDDESAEKAARDTNPDIQTNEPIVILYAEASPEWYIAQYGCLLAECVVVPVLDGTPEEEVVEIIERCSPSTIITSEKLLEAVKRIATGVSVQNISIVMLAGAGKEPFNATTTYSNRGHHNSKRLWDTDLEQVTVTTLSDVVELGVHAGSLNAVGSGSVRTRRQASLRPSVKRRGKGKIKGDNYQPRMLIPTSGSCGKPKLIVVTDDMIVRQFAVPRYGVQTIMYSCQPIRQSFDTLIKGGSIGLWSGNLDCLHTDIAVLRPTHFGSTPKFWETQLQQFNELIRQAEQFGEGRGDEERTGRGDSGKETALATAVREQLVKRWREKRLLGNRCRAVLIGGASSSAESKLFITKVFGARVMDSHGISETGSIANNAEVTGSSELQLVDAPELGYLTTDEPYPRGEIVANTYRLTPGYYNDPQANEHAFEMIGGTRHFRTGDIGLLINGKIRLIDKKSAMFKLSNGVYVAPAPLEDVYSKSTLISQCIVYSTLGARTVGIVVVLTESGKKACFPNGSPGIDADSQPVLSECARLARESGRKPYEVPQQAVLTTDPWTVTNGLLTYNFKICRPRLLQALERFTDIAKAEPISPDRPEAQRMSSPALFSTLAGSALAGSAARATAEQTASATVVPSAGPKVELASGLEHILRSHIPALAGDTPMPVFAHTIYHLGADSLTLATLRSALNDRFGISIPLSRLASASIWEVQTAVLGGGVASLPFTQGSPEELKNEVLEAEDEMHITSTQRRKARVGSQIISMVDMDASKGLSIHWYNNSSGCGVVSGAIFSKKTADSVGCYTVFLTGATGFVGSFLLNEIIREDPTVHVICLVRAETNEAAALRVSNTLAYYQLPCTSLQWSAMAGDLEKKRFGFSKEAYSRLEDCLDEVYHAGAIVNAALPFSAIRGANIDGTRRIVELSLHADANLHHISTISVLSNSGVKTEVLEVPVPRIKASAYAKSKWVAEQIVISGAEHFNLKARIYRLGTMAAHSVTGACNPNDTFTRILEGLMHLGAYPVVTHAHEAHEVHETHEAHFPDGFYLTPIDWAVRAIHSVADRPFHRHRDDGSLPVGMAHMTSNDVTEFATAIEAIDEIHEAYTMDVPDRSDALLQTDSQGESSHLEGSTAAAAPMSPSRRKTSVGLGRWEANSNDDARVESSRSSISLRLSTLLGAEVGLPNEPTAAERHIPPNAVGNVPTRRRRSASWKALVPVTPAEFHERLGAIGVDNPLFPFRETLLKRHPPSGKRPIINMAQTLEHIAPCPLICVEELCKMLNFLGTKSSQLPSSIGPPLIVLKPRSRSSSANSVASDGDGNKHDSDMDDIVLKPRRRSSAANSVDLKPRRRSSAANSVDLKPRRRSSAANSVASVDDGNEHDSGMDGEMPSNVSLFFPDLVDTAKLHRNDGKSDDGSDGYIDVGVEMASPASLYVAEEEMVDGPLHGQRTSSYKEAVATVAAPAPTVLLTKVVEV